MKKRSYKQNCSLALASDVLCERWTLLIFRELLIQPCRFKQLNTWLGGMGTNLLAQRLKELEAEGFIGKKDPEDKRSAYQLTTKGLDIEPIVMSLINWGHGNLTGDDEFNHFHHWDLLAMKALFKPAKCKQPMIVQFESEALTAWVRATSLGLTYAMGRAEKADITLNMSIADLQNEANKGVTFEQGELQDFIGCFD